MLKHIYAAAAVLIFCALTLNYANAEDEWDPVSAGTVTTWTAPLCAKGELVAQPFFFYNNTRGTFNSDGHYDSLPSGDKKYQFLQQLFAQYGLTDRFEIDAQIEYQENFLRQNGDSANSSGFGDSVGFLRYCLQEETGSLPYAAALFQLKIPTGEYQHADDSRLGTDLTGAGSWDPGLGIILTKKFKPFVAHCDFIYSAPLETKIDGVKTRYADYLNYDFGLEYFLSHRFNLMFEANGFLQSDKKEDGARTDDSNVNYFTVSPGIGWSCEKIQVVLAYQRVLTGTNADANDSVVLTFVRSF